MRGLLVAVVAIVVLALQVSPAHAIGRRGGCSTGGCSSGCGSGGCSTSGSGCQVSSSGGCNIQPQITRASAADLLQQPSAPVLNKAVNPALEAEARAKAKAAAAAVAERRRHTLPFAFAWSQPVAPKVDGSMGK